MLYPSGNIDCKILSIGITWPGYSASSRCCILFTTVFIPLGVEIFLGVLTGVLVTTAGGLPKVGTVLDKAGKILLVSLFNKVVPIGRVAPRAAGIGGGDMLVLATGVNPTGVPSVVGKPKSLNIVPVNVCLPYIANCSSYGTLGTVAGSVTGSALVLPRVCLVDCCTPARRSASALSFLAFLAAAAFAAFIFFGSDAVKSGSLASV
jgi:hypothetical protein